MATGSQCLFKIFSLFSHLKYFNMNEDLKTKEGSKMNEETKILLDRIESTAKSLDKYFFVLLIFIVYGFSTFLQKEATIKMPWIETEISNAILFHAIISITLTIVFGLIGSGLLDYFTRRKIFDDQLAAITDKKMKDLTDSLVSGSLYDTVYRTKDYPTIPRIVVVSVMVITLTIPNFISLYHAFTIISIDKRIGWPLFLVTALVVLILLI